MCIRDSISSIHNNLFTNEHLLEEYYDANYFTVKTTDFNAEKEMCIRDRIHGVLPKDLPTPFFSYCQSNHTHNAGL